MYQADVSRKATPSPARTARRQQRQPRIVQVNRDAATMVEAQTPPPLDHVYSNQDTQTHMPFRSRTFSDGFIRNTSQELLLGVDCEVCRTLPACTQQFRAGADKTWHGDNTSRWNGVNASQQNFDLICNCDLGQYNYVNNYMCREHERNETRNSFEAPHSRKNMTARAHHSLDRKHGKIKSGGVSTYISKQFVAYEPTSSFVQRLKKNLSTLKKIGGDAMHKKQHTVQLNDMAIDSSHSLGKGNKSSISKEALNRGYSQSCIFTASKFPPYSSKVSKDMPTYANFTENIDQCLAGAKESGFADERPIGKIPKMRSFDMNDRLSERSASTLGNESLKFSTLESRNSRCRSIPRQMSYNEFTTLSSHPNFSPRRKVIPQPPSDFEVKPDDSEYFRRAYNEDRSYNRDYIPDGDLIVFDSSHGSGACQCTCGNDGRKNVDKKASSIFYDKQDKKYRAPAPDVTARAPPGHIHRSMMGPGEPCAACKGPAWASNTATTSSHSSSSAGNSSKLRLSNRRWCCVAALVLVAGTACVAGPLALRASPGAPLAERLLLADRLLMETPLVDGHNDLPWNIRKFLHNRIKDFRFDQDLRTIPPWATSSWSHTDLSRMKQGRIAAQFWAAYVPCEAQNRDAVQLTFEQIDVIRRLTEKYHPQLTLCTSAKDIRTAHTNQQVCSLVGVEGGHALGGSLGVLRALYALGVRYLTLTSTCDTPWAECASSGETRDEPSGHGGLTAFGKVVIKEMNRLGMMVDLSHVSARTMRDALAASRAPVLFSHSAARALCNTTRNVPDGVLRRLAINRGLVMVNFYASFLACHTTATVHDAIAHINHIRDVAGVDYVGLGAGFDGINYTPQGLEDVSTYPLLFAELMEAGWSIEDLRKLAGLNFLRVMEAAERVSDEMGVALVTPYEDTILPRPPDPHNCSSQDLF